MGKYFGTDGFRGEANTILDAQRAFDIGRYLGYYYHQKGETKILIGKDTRLSGSMLEMALASGLAAQGIEAYLLGVCPTPAIAYLTVRQGFSGGVMISASHNPYYDNGIKIFDGSGIKIGSEIEDLIEKYVDGEIEIQYQTHEAIGQVIDYHHGLDYYLNWLKENHQFSLQGMKIVLDCANGSASTTAYQLLSCYGAEVVVMNDTPNGININEKCGSTHPEALQKAVLQHQADVGFAFDGDADRLIAVDSKGRQVTGDHILYLCSKALKLEGELTKNTVVTTVMANLGLFKALEKEEIETTITAVGDKYVFEEMQKSGCILGGEQSGHIIFSRYLPTGDGLLTALQLLKVMSKSEKSLVQLVEGLNIFPQLLVNVKVQDKKSALASETLKKEIDLVTAELGDSGRILVRPSGTEPLIRVMVEAENDAICQQQVNRIVSILK